MSAEKGKLSDKVMQMKFMTRKTERDVRKKLEEERAAEMRDLQWVLSTGDTGEATVVPDEEEAPQPRFIAGRRSYGSYNPQLEKVLKDAKAAAASEKDDRDEITPEKLTDRYEKYVGLRGRGVQRKQKEAQARGAHDDSANPRPQKRARIDAPSPAPAPAANGGMPLSLRQQQQQQQQAKGKKGFIKPKNPLED